MLFPLTRLHPSRAVTKTRFPRLLLMPL